jgi:hypothetical protein
MHQNNIYFLFFKKFIFDISMSKRLKKKNLSKKKNLNFGQPLFRLQSQAGAYSV